MGVLRRGTACIAALLGAGLMACLPIATARAETRTYVVNWFYMNNYYGGDQDCPEGLNPSSIDFYKREMRRLGYAEDQIEKIMDGYPGAGDGRGPWVAIVVHRGNGVDDVYENPETAPDPGLKVVKGKFAYGFNLDGRGADAQTAFEDPETHEKGIDNELYRLVGCIKSYRGGEGAARRPAFPDYVWDVLRDRMPAWMITVTADNWQDSEVTVTFDRALKTVMRDATGLSARVNMTFPIDPDPRGHSVVKGRVKDGVIMTEPGAINFIADAFGLTSDLNFTQAKLRLQMKPDGTLQGVLGGYQPWANFYWGNAGRSWAGEYLHSQDAVAMYYALRRMADGNPDPKTGEMRDISSAYAIEAIPAFTVPATARSAAAVRTSQNP